MKITAIKTRLIKAFDCSLEDIITESIESINENSVYSNNLEGYFSL